MTRRLIDSHFHLDHYKNHKELYDVINRLEQYTLCETNTPGIFISCKRLYKETKYVKFALGFHPQEKSLSAKNFSDFMTLINRTEYVGEVGMDFSSNEYISKARQIDFFDQIVNVCSIKNKVMSVHLRKSQAEAIEIIKKYHPKKCIIHWFSGTTAQLEELIALDCYFSINSNMVRNRNSKLLIIPQNKILVESDGPFTKVNGKKYTPELLLSAYQSIGEYVQIPNFIDQVYTNFKKLLLS